MMIRNTAAGKIKKLKQQVKSITFFEGFFSMKS